MSNERGIIYDHTLSNTIQKSATSIMTDEGTCKI